MIKFPTLLIICKNKNTRFENRYLLRYRYCFGEAANNRWSIGWRTNTKGRVATTTTNEYPIYFHLRITKDAEKKQANKGERKRERNCGLKRVMYLQVIRPTYKTPKYKRRSFITLCLSKLMYSRQKNLSTSGFFFFFFFFF